MLIKSTKFVYLNFSFHFTCIRAATCSPLYRCAINHPFVEPVTSTAPNSIKHIIPKINALARLEMTIAIIIMLSSFQNENFVEESFLFVYGIADVINSDLKHYEVNSMVLFVCFLIFCSQIIFFEMFQILLKYSEEM